jgi:hypothetical protein
VLACPVLAATAHEFKKSGWLGAAAAQIACERAQIVFGSSMRTLVPAELSGLKRVPAEGFPFDPYDADEVRKLQIDAAAKADAWLDGSIENKPGGFHVRLTLKGKDGKELGSGEADGMMVHEAVRGAMAFLFDADLIPNAPPTEWRDPWLGGASTVAALALHDLHVAVLAENEVVVRADCGGLRKRTDLGGMKGFVETLCAERLGEQLPPKPEIDRSTPGAILTSAATLRLYEIRTDADRAVLTGLAKELEDLAMKQTGDARSLLSAAAAEVYYALADRDQSERLALLSIGASPKIVDVRGNAWHRLSFTSETGFSNLASHCAWLPWEPFGQGGATSSVADEERASRAAALAMRGYWYTAYGELLIAKGKPSNASIVAAVGDSAYLTVEVLRAQNQLGKAFGLGMSKLAEAPTDHRDVGSPTASLARATTELAVILEKPLDFTDAFVARFIDPDPPLVSKGALGFFGAMAVCLQAPQSVQTRCVKRVDALFHAGHWGAALPGATQVLGGALRFIEGDMPSAAKIWRPLAAHHIVINDSLNEPLVKAFEAGAEPDLADRIDTIEAAPENKRLSLAAARCAVRAEKKGNCAKAREYAQRIVDAWDAADERPPVVDRMKKLLSRCVSGQSAGR